MSVLALIALVVLVFLLYRQEQRIKALERAQAGFVTDSVLWPQLRLYQQSQTEVAMDLTSRLFSRVDSEYGTFLVMIEDVVPYLDGYKIRLFIGNPSFATYFHSKIKVKWGSAFRGISQNDVDQWSKGLRRQEYPLVQSLRAGSWNKAEIILSGTSAEETRYFEISLETPEISLLNAPSPGEYYYPRSIPPLPIPPLETPTIRVLPPEPPPLTKAPWEH
jgi:hypothetical protein